MTHAQDANTERRRSQVSREDFESLKSETSEIKGMISDCKQKINARVDERIRGDEAIVRLYSRVDSLEGSIKIIGEQVARAVKNGDDRLKEHDDEIVYLKHEFDHIKSEFAKLRKDLIKLDSQITDLKEDFTGCRNDIREHGRLIRDLNGVVSGFCSSYMKDQIENSSRMNDIVRLLESKGESQSAKAQVKQSFFAWLGKIPNFIKLGLGTLAVAIAGGVGTAVIYLVTGQIVKLWG